MERAFATWLVDTVKTNVEYAASAISSKFNLLKTELQLIMVDIRLFWLTRK